MGGHTLRRDVRGSVSSVTRGYPYCREFFIRQHDTFGAHLATTLTSGFSGGWSARSPSTCSRTPTRTRPRRSLPGLAEAGVRALSVPDRECCAVLLRGRPPVGWDSFVFSPGIHGQQGGRLRGLPVPHRGRPSGRRVDAAAHRPPRPRLRLARAEWALRPDSALLLSLSYFSLCAYDLQSAATGT